jgi:hypothetical protein
MASWKERPNACKDEHEMFLTKLLVGNEIKINRHESPSINAECRALSVPPINPVTGLKYNTVTGRTKGSQVWIVYENGRAYPDYLVRYYRGERDKKRTPFATEARARESWNEAKEEPSFRHPVAQRDLCNIPFDLEIANLNPSSVQNQDCSWNSYAQDYSVEPKEELQDLVVTSISAWEYSSVESSDESTY